LWQEGHSAFAQKHEADEEVLQILDLYARVYEEIMAVPVIKGRKSEKEKFAGGLYTTTVEAYIPANGRAIQGATSHCLGQNFSKMFHIEFLDTDGQTKHAWQNSWGLTTRTIGVMVMVHGDDKGLVLPPNLAPVQVIVLPIVSPKDGVEMNEKVTATIKSITELAKIAGIRMKVDQRDIYSPGWKFAHWEQKGVPLRLEIGPRDVENNQMTLVRRDTGAKQVVPLGDDPTSILLGLLKEIQSDMLEAARKERDSHLSTITTWAEFIPALDKRNIVLAPWCERVDCEAEVKDRTGPKAAALAAAALAAANPEAAAEEAAKGLSGAAKTLCIPFSQPPMDADAQCFTGCLHKAVSWTLWGRSY
jgi:prolyl-tRNA synthetase